MKLKSLLKESKPRFTAVTTTYSKCNECGKLLPTKICHTHRCLSIKVRRAHKFTGKAVEYLAGSCA